MPLLLIVPGPPATAGPLVLSPVNVSACPTGEESAALARTLTGEGVRLCLTDSDPDHNRTVLSLLGPPGGIARAILALFSWALAHVDLARHTGVHPRVGSVDVVPLVPVRGTDMAACVAMSRRLGREIGDRFGVPVFLYGHSAAAPARAGVASIRRGGSEGLAARMAGGGDWAPDFGPGEPNLRAGVSILGARDPLIAFNVDLEGSDLETARAVARAVRESSGGLPGLMAIGVELAGRRAFQVAMNVTRVRPGCLEEAFDRVVGEAGKRGAEVAGSEIIGLVPEAAWPPGGARRLRSFNWSPERLVEFHVRAWDASH